MISEILLYPLIPRRWGGVRGAPLVPLSAAAAGEASDPDGEASVGLVGSTALRRWEENSAHFCGSQVDGREVLLSGTERLVPRDSAPASALSC